MRIITSLAIGIIIAGVWGVVTNSSMEIFSLLVIGWANLAYQVLED